MCVLKRYHLIYSNQLVVQRKKPMMWAGEAERVFSVGGGLVGAFSACVQAYLHYANQNQADQDRYHKWRAGIEHAVKEKMMKTDVFPLAQSKDLPYVESSPSSVW
eukprot:gb/GECG01012647.1/.p1 GENE.gb/GECG01012647.1/~~gb/GECG01012647.1/.p1  ORF type:complete len:105 (+),score=6.49 gb/GECG01012647.1/:1-315(+)